MNLNIYRDYTSDPAIWARILDENMCLFNGRKDGPSDNIFTNSALKVVECIKDKESVLVVGTAFGALQRHILENTNCKVESVSKHHFDLDPADIMGYKHYLFETMLDIPIELQKKKKHYDVVIFLDTFSSMSYGWSPKNLKENAHRFSLIADEVLIFETISIDEYEVESHPLISTYWAKNQYEEYFSDFELKDFERFEYPEQDWLDATLDFWMENINGLENEIKLDVNNATISEKDTFVVNVLKERLLAFQLSREQIGVGEMVTPAKLHFALK